MTTADQEAQRLVNPVHSDQRQFNDELSLLVAVSAQLCPKASSYMDAVEVAIELIRTAETRLKRLYDKQEPASETRTEPPVSAPLQPRPSRKVIEESITAASQVIIAKKLKSQDELLAMLGAYGVKNKSQLNDEQAVKLLEQLKAILK